MRYVIVRDDDTNAFTPVECLERLYRPFLERSLPVNLAVIPEVRTDAVRPDGRRERFVFARMERREPTMPIGHNQELASYLRGNPGFHIAQHGCEHSSFEFDSPNTDDVCDRLERGSWRLEDAGFSRPQTFVAPHDRFSRLSLGEVAKRFRVISAGWFELARLPVAWWPRYALKKLARSAHWRVGRTLLMSHPGCLLSCQRPRATMLEQVKQAVLSQRLTVLVTHWWEYFRNGHADEAFIETLHQTGFWLAAQTDVTVVSFDDVAEGQVSVA